MKEKRESPVTQSVAIVTGASSGIGRATALRLARDFSAIVVVARRGDALRDVADQIRPAGAEAFAIEADLSGPDAAEVVVGRTVDRFGRIDALMNIAGAVPGLDLFEMTDAQWAEGMALKFHGARRLTIRAWEVLAAAKGSVVFTSGSAATTPKPGAAAIGAINAAIEALAKAFSERGIADAVQVNCVSPGAVMTGRRLALIERTAKARGVSVEEVKRVFLHEAGVARFGEPEEIAELMAFATSPASRSMTGTVLRMDGGEVKSV
jgi:3-oxoacyl-[acyl-carrier protein] reductase